MRMGFTLIEILITVVIVTITVLGIAKMQEQNIQTANYLSGRIQSELYNSLFLGPASQGFRKDEKDAYELTRHFGVSQSKSREFLRKTTRTITFSESLPIGEMPVPVRLHAVMLGGEYPARYYRIIQ